MNKYLIIKGCAGLGNRLMTICAAIEYCKKTNRILFVDWTDGQFGEAGVNAFNDFFEIKNFPVILNLEEIINFDKLTTYPEIWGTQPLKNIYDIYIQEGNNYFQKLPNKLLFGRLKMLPAYWKYMGESNEKAKYEMIDSFKALFRKNDLLFGGDLSLGINEDVIFYADFRPNYSDKTFLRYIFLKESIQHKVNDIALKWRLDDNTIGVNVRSTDKKPLNSIEFLFEKIDNMPLHNPTVYLATDNKKILERFKIKYTRLVFYERFLPDVTTEGIHQWSLYQNKPKYAKQILYDSIMQLWLLSKCQYVFYQGNSSFSILAKMLHMDKGKSFNWDSEN